jgi:transcriptional regulator with XRE-family HTH domain
MLAMMRKRVIQRAEAVAPDAIVPRISKAFGKQLQGIRQSRNVKEIALAEALGVSRTTASNIECGRQRVFLDQVYRAAAALGVPVDALLPAMHLVASDQVLIRSPADDPLSAEEHRSVEAIVREISAGASTSSRRRRSE